MEHLVRALQNIHLRTSQLFTSECINLCIGRIHIYNYIGNSVKSKSVK